MASNDPGLGDPGGPGGTGIDETNDTAFDEPSDSGSAEEPGPGRTQEAILRRLLGPDRATPFILGDLREEFREVRENHGRRTARSWYWTQVFTTGCRLLVRRATHTGNEMLHDLLLDIRFGLRSLTRRPLFATAIVLTLGLGVAGSTTMFTLVNKVLIQDLPYQDPDRLVSIWKSVPEWKGVEGNDYLWDRLPLTWFEAQTLGEEAATLSEMAISRVRSGSFRHRSSSAQQKISVGVASANLLEVLGVRPSLGRFFSEDEAYPGAGEPGSVAVLSHEFWTRVFGSDPRVLGQVHWFRGVQREVIGVLPAGFRLPSDGQSSFYHRGGVDPGLRDVWIPLDEGPDNEILARLAPGASLEAARAEVGQVLASAFSQENLRSYGQDGVEVLPRVEARKQAVTRGFGGPLILLWGASGLLLAVACVNIAGLLAGAAVDRRREVRIRSALGAGSGRLQRMLLTETVVMGLIGSILGILLTWVSMDAVLAFSPGLPRAEEISMDGGALGFGLACGLGTGLLFGLAPAWISGKVSLSTRGQAAERGSGAAHRGILMAQIALTTVLLIVGGLLARSFRTLLSVDPGFDVPGLVAADVLLPGVADQTEFINLISELRQSVESLPTVVATTAAIRVPFGGLLGNDYFGFHRNGEPVEVTIAAQRGVLPNYHSVMGIDILQGRPFSPVPGGSDTGEMIVTRGLAEHIWPGESPVGQTVERYGKTLTIVGVSDDVRKKELGSEPDPVFYLNLLESPHLEFTLAARTVGPEGPVVGSIANAIHAVNQDITVSGTRTMESMVMASEADDRFRAVLVMVFAGLATLISMVGVFSVAARAVIARSREIAVRKALGAPDRGLMAVFVRDGIRAGTPGVALGVVVAYAGSGLLDPFLFRVPGRDPATYLLVASLLVATCALAAYLPARRILGIEPRNVLSAE